MNFKVDDRNIKNTDLSSIRILLADSDPSKIAQVISYTEQQFRPSVRVCKSYVDLLPMLREELPEIMLLGMFDTFNSFDICQECRQNWEQLPIVLLSRQKNIDDYFHYFRRMAITKGAIDVVSHDLLQLDRLFQELLRLQTTTAQIATTVTVQNMLTAMTEITQIGNNYFGPLAQGNYWRKAHACIIDKFPALEHWSADHFGIISCNETILQSPCTEKDLQSLRSWVGVYLSECERIIVDFGDILKQSNLSPAALHLLSDLASSPTIT
jgi:CheY-like chemotaxis protein